MYGSISGVLESQQITQHQQHRHCTFFNCFKNGNGILFAKCTQEKAYKHKYNNISQPTCKKYKKRQTGKFKKQPNELLEDFYSIFHRFMLSMLIIHIFRFIVVVACLMLHKMHSQTTQIKNLYFIYYFSFYSVIYVHS